MIQCGYRLEDTGRTVTVPGACCGHEVQAVHRCGATNGECIDVGSMPGLTACNLCTIPNRPPTFPAVKPASYAAIRFPSQASKDGAFNCSIHGDQKAGFAFAFRSGWTGSEIRLCRLAESGRPIGAMMPAFTFHERAPRGREDPRLFRFQGRWHFSFTGYEKDKYFCSVLVAEIDQWPTVSRVWYPQYDQRHPEAEKNWGFFEHGDRLHAVYRIGPGEHRVLQFDGSNVCEVYSLQWEPGWKWGEMRGGASPILHNGEWYSWFHGHRVSEGKITYTAGLYTFEDTPPFKPLRMIRGPVVIGGLSHVGDQGWRKAIYYPCGAAIKSGKWWVSAGEHDNRCTLASFDAAEIEKELKPCH